MPICSIVPSRHNMKMQICMALPRHVLTALEMPLVSHVSQKYITPQSCHLFVILTRVMVTDRISGMLNEEWRVLAVPLRDNFL
jgi:hypothetical protein